MEETICPKCGGRMEERELVGVPLDRCTGCKGIWLDYTALDHVLNQQVSGDHAIGTARELMIWSGDRETDMPCPRCTSWLAKHMHEEIEIEWCRSCRGIYLDNEEIQSIIAWKRRLVKQKHKNYRSSLFEAVFDHLFSRYPWE